MSDDDDARVPGDAYLQLGAELQSCTEEIKAIEAQQASLEAQKVVLKTRLRGIESQLGLPSSMPDTPNNGLLEAITKCLAPKPAVASKINGADGTTLSALATPATPGVVLAGEVEPPPVKLDQATCFLTLVERNGGALVAHWSEIAVAGALASFVPNEPPPRFKLAAKGDELKRNVNGPNMKNYYDGWAIFIKLAQSHRGMFTFLANAAQKPVAIHLNDEHLRITKARAYGGKPPTYPSVMAHVASQVPLGKPFTFERVRAASVIADGRSIDYKVITMTPRIFAEVAERNGAAVAFDGGGDAGGGGDVAEMRRRSSRSNSLRLSESFQAEIGGEGRKKPPPPPPTPPESPPGRSVAPLSLAPALADVVTPPHISTPWPTAQPEPSPS